MRVGFLSVVVAFLVATTCLSAFAGSESPPRVEDLIALHDLGTSVSIGNYYLKQESLVSIRSYLSRRGQEEGLGDDWNEANPWWRQAEESLLEELMQDVEENFSNLHWLHSQWVDLYAEAFSDDEIARLAAHFRTETGAKQLQIIDHTVSTHVMMALSFSGKFKTLPGVEHDRARMQHLWNEEDARMRFSVKGTDNADAQAFALSPLGKKYFTTVILSLTGIISRCIEQVAAQSPAAVTQLGGGEQPFLEGFKLEPV
jgi:hypothetical protein